MVLVARDARIAEQDTRIAELEVKLARLEHLLSRNSGNSSMPPSKDDDPGRTPPPVKPARGGQKRMRGKQPGAPGANLSWIEAPGERVDRFPQGCCQCGAGLAEAIDLGAPECCASLWLAMLPLLGLARIWV